MTGGATSQPRHIRNRWRALMRFVILISSILVLASCESYTPLDMQKVLSSSNFNLVDSIIKAGQPNFLIIERDIAGVIYDPKDSCWDVAYSKYVLLPIKSTNEFKVHKYNECGWQKPIIAELPAVDYLFDHRHEIGAESIVPSFEINHALCITAYEIRDKNLILNTFLCPEEINHESDIDLRDKYLASATYQFVERLITDMTNIDDLTHANKP